MSGSEVTSWLIRDFSNLSILMLSDKDPKRTVQLIQGTLNTVQIADDTGRVAQVTFNSDSGLPTQIAVKMVGKDWVSAPKRWPINRTT